MQLLSTQIKLIWFCLGEKSLYGILTSFLLSSFSFSFTCGSFSWPILLQIPPKLQIFWPFLGASGVCQAIYFWWVIHKKKFSRRKKKKQKERRWRRKKKKRRRSGFKSAVIFAGIWSFFGSVELWWRKTVGVWFWVSLVFGCGVLMEQNGWFFDFFGFLFQFAPLSSDLLPSLLLFLLLLLLLCVCVIYILEEEWGKGKGRFLIQHNVWKKQKKRKGKKDWVFWVLVL